MKLKMMFLSLFISIVSLLSSSAHDLSESTEAKSPIDVIQHQILPQRLDMVFKKLSSKCRTELEVPMRTCLKDYDDHTSHARFLENEYHETKRVGCCHVWKYDNCVISLVRSRARTSIYSCTEDDVFQTEEILDLGEIDPVFNHLCHGYHENSYFCNNEPTQLWLLILLWVIGGAAILIALSGAICMLFLFVTSGSVSRPRIFILNTEGTKSLIDNMDA